MNDSCPWCNKWYPPEEAEKLYWHIKIHNASEEARQLLERKFGTSKNKGNEKSEG